MIKKYKIIIIFLFTISLISNVLSENNFYLEAKKNYEEKKYDVSKFLFQRNIVFNPKDENSYLYLSKIYNFEENEREKEKNINAVLLINPKNEEAIYLLTLLSIKKSNFSKAKQLISTLASVCKEFCSSKKELMKKLDSAQKSK